MSFLVFGAFLNKIYLILNLSNLLNSEIEQPAHKILRNLPVSYQKLLQATFSTPQGEAMEGSIYK